MSNTNFLVAADLLHSWRDDVLSGAMPALYPLGQGELERIEIGPGRVLLLGGAPGAGKSAFTMQAVVDTLRLTPTLRALVCNVEMTPAVLLDRQLARLAGIDLNTIRIRKLGVEHGERIDAALQTLESVAERLCFVRPPFDLENVAASADAFGAGLIVLDYIQRISRREPRRQARVRSMRRWITCGSCRRECCRHRRCRCRKIEGPARPLDVSRGRAQPGIIPRKLGIGIRG